MKEVGTIKQLKIRSNKLSGELSVLKESASQAQREYSNKLKKFNEIQDKIEYLNSKNNELKMSEHAYFRYFERVAQVDLDKVSQSIIEEIRPMVETLGNGTYPYKEWQVVVKNNTIVTIK